MNAWLLTVGEPLPLPGSRDRLWRTGLLAEALVGRGHDVLWWTSTMDHFRKVTIVAGEPRIDSTIGAQLQFLHGRRYSQNVSLSRIVNHVQLGRSFRQKAQILPRPDIVLCSFPTIELSAEAVRYGLEQGVTTLLDVRDLWPDIFLNVLPSWMRPAGRLALRSQFKKAATALSGAAALLAVSPGYLNWALERAGRARGAGDCVFPLGYQPAAWTVQDERTVTEQMDKCGVDWGRGLVTFAGTFGRSYDLATAIEAARQLARAGNDRIQFVFCGAGERASVWKELARDLSNVSFPGWLSAGELSYLLGRSLIGLAAYAEGAPQGIPNKVIEYLAAGLPVVCSLPGEARSLLQSLGCGRYYAAGDAAALAQCIAAVSSNAANQRDMSAAARAAFDAQFSATGVYAAMADHLERLADAGRSTLKREQERGQTQMRSDK